MKALALAIWIAATTVPAFTTEQLTAQAALVVRARIVEKQVARVGGRLATFYAADVAQSWKGAAPARVRFAIPGGVQGGIGQVVPGAPVFDVDDDVVLFLSAPVGPAPFGGEGARATIGLWQGAFIVDGDVAVPRAHEAPAVPVDLGALEARVRAVRP